MTILAKLLVSESDPFGYITYIFEVLEEEEIKRLGTKYVLTVRFPNWDHRDIKIGEIGFLCFFEIKAGIDKWFDGNKMIPYRYNNIQFIKFIEKPEEKTHKFTM